MDHHNSSDMIITLRPFDLSDIDDFMVWATDDRVARFCTWEPYKTKEDAINYIQKTIIPHPWCKAICLNDIPVGTILVTKNTGNDVCRGEVGYCLGAKCWGKGIGTEAVRLVAKSIFNEWSDLERLEGYVDVDNVGSQKVLEKVGFKKEVVLRKFFKLKGVTRDMVVFSLLSTDLVLGG